MFFIKEKSEIRIIFIKNKGYYLIFFETFLTNIKKKVNLIFFILKSFRKFTLIIKKIKKNIF